MKKIVLILFMMLLFTGCEKGVKTYRIELDSNITTGYTWEYQIMNDGVIKEVTNEYLAPKDTDNLGAGGKQIFEFVGVKKGKVEIRFTYRRPWESTSDEKGVIYILNVDSDLNIKLKSKENWIS